MTQPMAVYVRTNDILDIRDNLERSIISIYSAMRIKRPGWRNLFLRRVGVDGAKIWYASPDGRFRWRDIMRKYPGEIIHWWNFIFLSELEINLAQCVARGERFPADQRRDVADVCMYLVDGIRRLIRER